MVCKVIEISAKNKNKKQPNKPFQWKTKMQRKVENIL